MAQVKGVPILGLIKFVKKNMQDVLPKVTNSLPPESKKYLEEHIILSAWYPYKLYTDLLRALDKIVGKGNLSYCIELGRLSAQHDLSSVYKVFANYEDPRMLVSSGMAMWNSYYDCGQVELAVPSNKEMLITIKEFPDIDIAHVKNVQGWIEQFFIMYKLKNVKSEITKCQYLGDPLTEIRFTSDWR